MQISPKQQNELIPEHSESISMLPRWHFCADLTAFLCCLEISEVQWNSWKLLDQFHNFSKHEVIKDFNCCNYLLTFVGVMTFNQQRKCILAARNWLHHWQKTSRPILFLREFSFSSIWTAKTSLRSVLTTVRSRKRKILSWKRNFAFEFFHLRATSFQPLGTIISPQFAQTKGK